MLARTARRVAPPLLRSAPGSARRAHAAAAPATGGYGRLTEEQLELRLQGCELLVDAARIAATFALLSLEILDAVACVCNVSHLLRKRIKHALDALCTILVQTPSQQGLVQAAVRGTQVPKVDALELRDRTRRLLSRAAPRLAR